MPRKLEDGTEVYTQEELEARLKEENQGLVASQQKAMDQLKDTQRKLQALQDQYDGIDPKQVKKLLEEQDNREREKAKEKGDWEAREQQLTDGLKAAHKKEVDALKSRLDKLDTSLRKAIVSQKLTEAIVAKKGDASLLLPHAERFVDVRETDDGFEAFVVDDYGQAAVADGQGTPMTFEQLVEGKLATMYPRAFDGTGSSGSGASKSSNGGASGHNVVAADDDDGFIQNLEGIASGEVAVR